MKNLWQSSQQRRVTYNQLREENRKERDPITSPPTIEKSVCHSGDPLKIAPYNLLTHRTGIGSQFLETISQKPSKNNQIKTFVSDSLSLKTQKNIIQIPVTRIQSGQSRDSAHKPTRGLKIQVKSDNNISIDKEPTALIPPSAERTLDKRQPSKREASIHDDFNFAIPEAKNEPSFSHDKSNSHYFIWKYEQSKALQQQFSNLNQIPLNSPIRLDPQSQNFSQFQHKFNKMAKIQQQRVIHYKNTFSQHKAAPQIPVQKMAQNRTKSVFRLSQQHYNTVNSDPTSRNISQVNVASLLISPPIEGRSHITTEINPSTIENEPSENIVVEKSRQRIIQMKTSNLYGLRNSASLKGYLQLARKENRSDIRIENNNASSDGGFQTQEGNLVRDPATIDDYDDLSSEPKKVMQGPSNESPLKSPQMLMLQRDIDEQQQDTCISAFYGKKVLSSIRNNKNLDLNLPQGEFKKGMNMTDEDYQKLGETYRKNLHNNSQDEEKIQIFVPEPTVIPLSHRNLISAEGQGMLRSLILNKRPQTSAFSSTQQSTKLKNYSQDVFKIQSHKELSKHSRQQFDKMSRQYHKRNQIKKTVSKTKFIKNETIKGNELKKFVQDSNLDEILFGDRPLPAETQESILQKVPTQFSNFDSEMVEESILIDNVKDNFQSHGYMKAPDYRYKQEIVQRSQEKIWHKQRGGEPKQLLNQGVDFITQKKQVVPEQEIEKKDTEIMRFCTTLFENWLEDYENLINQRNDKNGTSQVYIFKEGLAKNLKDKCLPIDYFIERILQVGLCRTIQQIKEILRIMLTFDNAGFQDYGPDFNYSQDNFKPTKQHNRQSENYIRKNLDKNQFNISNRVSLNQFLSLFNVFGPHNQLMLDNFIGLLGKQTPAKPKITPLHHINQHSTRNLSAQQRKTIGRALSFIDKKSMFIHLEDFNFCNLQQESKFYNQIIELFKQINTEAQYEVKTAKLNWIKSQRQCVTSKHVHIDHSLKLGDSALGQDLIVDNILKLHNQRSSVSPQKGEKSSSITKNRKTQFLVGKNIFLDMSNQTIEERAIGKMNTKALGVRARMKQRQLQGQLLSKIAKLSTLDKESLGLLKEKQRFERIKQLGQDIIDKNKQQYEKFCSQINFIRKQAILQEIVKDILQAKSIIQGLLKYDKVSTPQQANIRQSFRKQFNEFIIHKIKDKYSKQLYLYNETGKGGHVNDANQARVIILEICAILMKNGIRLRSTLKHDDLISILASRDDVSTHISRLVIMILDQIKNSEEILEFPNEHIDSILEATHNLWYEKIDPSRIQVVPRKNFDQYLLENKIIKNYKQVNNLISGVLNGQKIDVNDHLKKSDFTTFVYKGIMRTQIYNIIQFCKIGHPDKENTSLAISQKVQRLQRFILYRGIYSKNTKAGPQYSQSCEEIIKTLQKVVNDPIVTFDKIQITLNEQQKWIYLQKQKQDKKYEVLTEFQPDHLIASIERDAKHGCGGHHGRKKLRFTSKHQNELKKVMQDDVIDFRQRDVVIKTVTLSKQDVAEQDYHKMIKTLSNKERISLQQRQVNLIDIATQLGRLAENKK